MVTRAGPEAERCLVSDCSDEFLVQGDAFGPEPQQNCLGLIERALAGELPMADRFQALARDLAARDGIFVLARSKGSVTTLFRDGSGLRTLYWAQAASSQVKFGTDPIEVGHAAQGIRRISRPALHEYLRMLDIAAPRSLVAGVHAVEAGVLIAIIGDEVLREEVSTPVGQHLGVDFEAAVNVLEAPLARSVATRLGGASRPAAFLSGGIDSALLCSMAARDRPDLTAVTVGFQENAFDESPVAARIAGHLGIRHEVLRFDRDEILDAFERLSTQADQPFADPTGPVTLLAFERCRERFDVVLDGTGADAAAGAMPPRHVRLAVQWASLMPRVGRLVLARLLRRTPRLAGYSSIVDFEHPADTMLRWQGFTRAEIEALCGEPVSFEDTTFYRTFSRFPRSAHYERYSALMAATPDDRVAQAMRISGLDVRFPFCDRDTERFLRQLPTEFKYMPGQPKRILRALLARYVPRALWDLPKHGFNFPLEGFLRGDGGRIVRDHLAAERWRKHGLLSPEGVEHYAQRFLDGDSRLTFRVWALVVLGAWLQRHDDLR